MANEPGALPGTPLFPHRVIAEIEELHNPNTGSRWIFPKDARRYVGQVNAQNARKLDGAPPCEHGHYDCAAWDRGPCSAEIRAEMLDAQAGSER